MKRFVVGGGEFANSNSLRMGQKAEDLFVDLCKENNLSFRYASKYENMNSHFDFIVNKFPLTYTKKTIEVKAMKCPKRGDPVDPTLIYVELQNVNGGKGWIFGEADIIAFEQPDEKFLCVNRDELCRTALEIAKDAPFGTQSGIKGTLWSRKDRNDLVLSLDRDQHILPLQSKFIFEKPF
jgi:hypothetical protein